jgi:prepilin-type processing-associated H-X9-DG protein
MQVDAILGLVRGVCIGLCVLAYLAGVVAGIKTQDVNRSGKRLALVIVILGLLLIVGTLPLKAKIGPIITMLAGYLTCALGAALLGGYGTGRKRSKNLPSGVALYLVVTLFVTGLALASMFSLLNPVAVIAKELFSSKKYDPIADKSCTENMQSLYHAFEKYVEYNDSMPPAESWQDQDDFKAAIQKDEWLHCPAVSNRHDNKFGYAYNAALSKRKLNGKTLKDMPDTAKTPLLYDSTDLAKNAHDNVTSLPKPGRHGGKNNILFCDGHIESVPPK